MRRGTLQSEKHVNQFLRHPEAPRECNDAAGNERNRARNDEKDRPADELDGHWHGCTILCGRLEYMT
jgi:hypothetical protein